MHILINFPKIFLLNVTVREKYGRHTNSLLSFDCWKQRWASLTTRCSFTRFHSSLYAKIEYLVDLLSG